MRENQLRRGVQIDECPHRSAESVVATPPPADLPRPQGVRYASRRDAQESESGDGSNTLVVVVG